MTPQLQTLLQLSGSFLAILLLAELLYRFARVPAEVTRKIVHIGSGMLTLLFPLCLTHIWEVALLCGSFLLLLAGCFRFGWLPSVHAINRWSVGSLLYPVAVFIAFCFFRWSVGWQHSPYSPFICFYAPMLVLTVCDPLAAFAGIMSTAHGKPGRGKTLTGSFSFLIAAFLLSFLLCSFFAMPPTYSVSGAIGLSVILAIACTAAEALAGRGWDNLTIPLAAMLVLTFNHLLIP